MLTSKSHPDIFAITTAIEQNENFEVHHKFMDDFDGNYQPYSLLIAFHVSLDESPLPTWHVLGAQTNSRQFDWLEINSLNSIGSEVLVNLKPFSFFQIDEEWAKWIPKNYTFERSFLVVLTTYRYTKIYLFQTEKRHCY